MTPDQFNNNLFLFGSVSGALVVETVACVVAPRVLAWTAFVPMLSRQFPMGPATRAALSTPDGQASYRSNALGFVDWSRLPGPRHFTAEGARFDLDASRARLLVRLPLEPFWFSFGGLAVLRLRAEDDTIVVGCRATPWLSLTSAAFFGGLFALAIAADATIIGALFVVLLVVFNMVAAVQTRRVFTPVVMAGVDAFAERVAR